MSDDKNLVHVTKQATGVMAYQLVGLVIGFGSNLIFARILGADLLGVFVLAQTTLLVLSLLASFGMGPTLLRFILDGVQYAAGDLKCDDSTP